MILNIAEEAGVLRAEVDDPALAPLTWYLEQEIGRSEETCLYMLSLLEAAERSGQPTEGTGNAHTLTIDPPRVAILNEFVLDSSAGCELSLSEFRGALTSWLEAIRDIGGRS